MKMYQGSSYNRSTDHGPFKQYFNRFSFQKVDTTYVCGATVDHPEHVILECEKDKRLPVEQNFRRYCIVNNSQDIGKNNKTGQNII